MTFRSCHFELENGVMTTPKHRSILSLILLDLTIKVNVKRERRFDRPTVIFKFKMRSKICVYIQL